MGGTHRESVVREAFKDLLKGWGRQHDLVFIPEYKLDSATKDTCFVDGALLHELRVPFGYWEAKDAKDDLDEEIAFKFKRGYPAIDARIKQTYIAQSTAQKTKLYDMYARFFRWASDRLHADGVLAFVTNRSFVDSRTFDGFRKTVATEFASVHVVDLGGDVRANPKLSGTKHNVFGIQTGVAISFFVKRQGAAGKKGCRVFYARRPEMETAAEKLAWLGSARAATLAFEEVRPDAKGNWLNLTANDFDNLLPLASKASKSAASVGKAKTVFQAFSLGVVTARDEWVNDYEQESLATKVQHLIDAYNADRLKQNKGGKNLSAAELDEAIKWSRAVKRDLAKGVEYATSDGSVVSSQYRPFVRQHLYFSRPTCWRAWHG